MVSHEEREAKIIAWAEERFLDGKNHFPARAALSALAIAFTAEPTRQEVIEHTNEGIVRMLDGHGAQAEVYTIREDIGSGIEDQPDFVLVHARNGVLTGETRRFGANVVIRARTMSVEN